MANAPTYPLRSTATRMLKNRCFLILCLVATSLSILTLVWLLTSILSQGVGMLNLHFLSGLGSKDANRAGFLPPLVGSVVLLIICATTAIPLGIGTAILLEEFKPNHPLLMRLHGFVQLNITNLAGVPSIVYGIMGLTAFANMFSLFGSPMNPTFTLGQRWYQQYSDISENSYYVPTGDGQSPLIPAHTGMTFYTQPSQSAPVAKVTIGSSATLEPIQDRIKHDLDHIEAVMVKQLNKTRTSRRGPVTIDLAAAQRITDAAFQNTHFKADIDTLQHITQEALLAMDGLKSRRLRKARRHLFAQLRKIELKAVNLKGTIMAGTLPSLKSVKTWYFLQLPFGRSVLAGGLTLMLVILPIIIVASQESIRAVPMSQRHGSLALGSTRWQAVAQVVLPSAVPGIMTGTILAMSRAIGEAAPLLMLGGVFITFLPSNAMDGFTAMPLQIFNWAGKPQADFRYVAAAGIIVLLAVLLSFNAVAVIIRQKAQHHD